MEKGEENRHEPDLRVGGPGHDSPPTSALYKRAFAQRLQSDLEHGRIGIAMLTYGSLPSVSPEAMLEDYWRYLDLSPEERQRQIRAVCRDAMRRWRAKTGEERARIEFANSWNADVSILRRWARECRDRAG